MSESKEESSVAVKIEETKKEQEVCYLFGVLYQKPQQSNDKGKKVLKLNKKKDSKKCPSWVKWLGGILIFALVVFILLIILFPDLLNYGNADYIRVLCRFSTSFDTDSKWLQTMKIIIDFTGSFFELKHYPFLKEVIIRDKDGFYFNGNVLITGLKRLKTINIGDNNFGDNRGVDYIEISHCPSLTSIVIGKECFRHYDKGLFLNGWT